MRIPRGGIVVALGSAGHDAPQAAEDHDPGAPDITRPQARHPAFGHGAHYGLDAPPARLGATIELRTLPARVTELELAVPADSLVLITSRIMRGVLSLPVRYRVG